jgi:hypothetical protein
MHHCRQRTGGLPATKKYASRSRANGGAAKYRMHSSEIPCLHDTDLHTAEDPAAQPVECWTVQRRIRQNERDRATLPHITFGSARSEKGRHVLVRG